MSDKIFRKKSLDQFKSPEVLDDYIQVTSPGVWLLLVTTIALLLGACVWGIFGHVESTISANIRIEDGTALCYPAKEDIKSVEIGMPVKFEGFEAVITDIKHSTSEGDVFLLKLNNPVPDGVFEGKIITGSVKPFSFVLN